MLGVAGLYQLLSGCLQKEGVVPILSIARNPRKGEVLTESRGEEYYEWLNGNRILVKVRVWLGLWYLREDADAVEKGVEAFCRLVEEDGYRVEPGRTELESVVVWTVALSSDRRHVEPA